MHLGIFALFVVLWCWYLSTRRPVTRRTGSFIWITIIGILLGYMMELVQKYFVPNRDYDLWDVVADGIGAIAGLLLSLKIFAKK
ncbi:VanZ family protein [Niabella sp. W65]|nr:VanZ family protein [Niabella sp. W65]MCH7362058.1 VanZ family protein [Niabella sp. W65]ULT45809.1 VanZ family protein [Niabella sp. I65]